MPSSNQVAHGLMSGVGHPNVRQFASPKKTGKHHRVTRIVLLAIARTNGSMAGSNNPTVETQIRKLAIYAVPAWASLVHKFHPIMATRQLPSQFGNRVRFVGDNADKANLPVSPSHRITSEVRRPCL